MRGVPNILSTLIYKHTVQYVTPPLTATHWSSASNIKSSKQISVSDGEKGADSERPQTLTVSHLGRKNETPCRDGRAAPCVTGGWGGVVIGKEERMCLSLTETNTTVFVTVHAAAALQGNSDCARPQLGGRTLLRTNQRAAAAAQTWTHYRCLETVRW